MYDIRTRRKIMKNDLYLCSETAKRLYDQTKDLPIVDYHCHLQPKEIFEDKQFETITQVWLGGDHYKWRLMRACGVDEELITGKADPKEKFIAYASCLETAAGNPLYVWSHMELKQFFNIDEPLTAANAAEIYDRANAYIQETGMSPRKLMKDSGVELVATTDDPIDSLEWHEKIAADENFSVKVVPSFRPDKAINLMDPDWKQYVEKLGQVAGIKTGSLAGFKAAISRRLDFFVQHGCRLSDVGIEDFPVYDPELEPGETYAKALKGEKITKAEYLNFLYEVYVYLAAKYKRYGMTMQLHLNSKRNESSKLFMNLGRDVGGDGVGIATSVNDVAAFLEACDRVNSLPHTILYSLNPSVYYDYSTAAGCFRNVTIGAAWWFLDHKRGIEEVLNVFAESYHLAQFPGMLTDSRSFLSYARHDYFRRIFCNYVAEMLNDGTFLSEEAALTICRKVFVENSRQMFS